MVYIEKAEKGERVSARPHRMPQDGFLEEALMRNGDGTMSLTFRSVIPRANPLWCCRFGALKKLNWLEGQYVNPWTGLPLSGLLLEIIWRDRYGLLRMVVNIKGERVERSMTPVMYKYVRRGWNRVGISGFWAHVPDSGKYRLYEYGGARTHNFVPVGKLPGWCGELAEAQ